MPGKTKRSDFKIKSKIISGRSIDPVPSGIYYFLGGIILFTAILYSKVLSCDFFNWDDTLFIFENSFIKKVSLKGISDLFTNVYNLNYQPLTMFTWMVEYNVSGFNPGTYHFINLLLHLVNVYLIFRLVMMLSGKIGLSLFTALFFGIHPFHVESVAWISERKDVLYTAFFLLSIISYIKYREKNFKTKFLVWALLFFLFSLFSKAMAVSLPLILVLLDKVFFGENIFSSKYLKGKLPFIFLSIVFSIVCFSSQRSGGGLSELSGYSFISKLILIPYSLSFYILNSFFPFRLSIFHSYPVINNGFLPIEYYLSLLFAGIIILLVYIAGKKNKLVIFGFLFFIITILPVLQVIPIGKVVVSERYSYVPFTGLFIAGLSLLYQLFESFSGLKRVLYLILSGFLIYFSTLTWNRVGLWKDGALIWNDFISKNPGNYYGYYGLAGASYSREIARYNRYIENNSTDKPYYGLKVEGKRKWENTDIAIYGFTKAIELNPLFVEAYLGRGNARMDKGENEKAIVDYNKVIEINPVDQRAYNNRAAIYYKMGKYDFAIEDYNVLINLNPSNQTAYLNRGLMYMTLKENAKACVDLRKAKALGSAMAEQFLNKFCK